MPVHPSLAIRTPPFEPSPPCQASYSPLGCPYTPLRLPCSLSQPAVSHQKRRAASEKKTAASKKSTPARKDASKDLKADVLFIVDCCTNRSSDSHVLKSNPIAIFSSFQAVRNELSFLLCVSLPTSVFRLFQSSGIGKIFFCWLGTCSASGGRWGGVYENHKVV